MWLCWRFIYLDHKRVVNTGKESPSITEYFQFSAMGQKGKRCHAAPLYNRIQNNKYTDFQLLSKIHPKFWLSIPNIEIGKNQKCWHSSFYYNISTDRVSTPTCNGSQMVTGNTLIFLIFTVWKCYFSLLKLYNSEILRTIMQNARKHHFSFLTQSWGAWIKHQEAK